MGGRSCVVSTFRLKRGKVSDSLFYARLTKVVNHELGHTVGLDHCTNEGCLMEDAKGKIKTVDNENNWFCPDCASKIKNILRE
jgi:archaemetzincin